MNCGASGKVATSIGASKEVSRIYLESCQQADDTAVQQSRREMSCHSFRPHDVHPLPRHEFRDPRFVLPTKTIKTTHRISELDTCKIYG